MHFWSINFSHAFHSTVTSLWIYNIVHPSCLSICCNYRKTGEITLPPSCRLDTKTQNPQADCGKKYKRNDVWYRQIWNHPECTAPMAGLIVNVSHFSPPFLLPALNHTCSLFVWARPHLRGETVTRCLITIRLSLNLHQKSLIHSDRENTWWPCILFPSPLIPS